jgi:recombination protein RecA
MQRTTKGIDKQVKERVNAPKKKKGEYDGNTEVMISTGSTLLDLAISGGRVRGGGIPGGIMLEIFGPESTGKTVLLCEIAGAIQRQGGDIMFHDPEARLNQQFAQIFDLSTEDMTYTTPNTVTEVFSQLEKWIPDNGKINGVITDSLAALSTNMEMDNEEGDKMGGRRAKEFSEGFRKTARLIKSTNLIMACSNQIRETMAAGAFAQKYDSPGGRAIKFYSSLRLRTKKIGSLSRSRTIKGKVHKQIYGIVIEIDVFKSSIWHPNRTARVAIDFEYGVDDIRENLNYLKEMTGTATFKLGDRDLGKNRDDAITIVENEGLEAELREAVINMWEEVEKKFKVERKKKKR